MRSGNGRRRPVVVATAAGLFAIALAGCGTRLPNSAFVGAGDSGVSAAGARGVPTASGTNEASGVTPGASGGSTAPGTGALGATGGANGSPGGSGGAPQGGAPGAAPGASGGSTRSAGGPNGGPNQASDVGVTANTITIGNVTAINGALGPYAFGVTLPGLQAWVNATNARGGINGRKIILDTCDDGEDGQQNLACTTKLVTQDHAFALIGNNTDACASSAHYEAKQNIPDVGFPLCNGYFMYPNMFSLYGSGYPRNGKLPAQNENQAQVYKWVHDNLHVSRGAFFFYIIPVSQQAGYFEETGANSVGISTAYEGGGNHEGENPADPTFDTDVINMRANKVDVIFDALDTAGNAKLCAAMDRQGFTVKAKVSTVEVFGQAVGQWSSPCRDSVYAADGATPYSDTSNPVVAQFRKDMATYEPHAQMHQWALDGYALGMLFGDALKSMGSSPTRAGMIKWLDAFQQPQSGGAGYNYDGLTSPVAWSAVNFSKPAPACDSIAQWSDAAGTFVTRAGANTCFNMPWYGTPFSSDGS